MEEFKYISCPYINLVVKKHQSMHECISGEGETRM